MSNRLRRGGHRAQPVSADPPVSAEASSMDVSAESHGHKRADEEPPAESPKRVKFADKGFSHIFTFGVDLAA